MDITGFAKDPKKKILLMSNADEWPSDDSDDETYSPAGGVIKTPKKLGEKKIRKKKKHRKLHNNNEEGDTANLPMAAAKVSKPKKEKRMRNHIKVKDDGNSIKLKIIMNHSHKSTRNPVVNVSFEQSEQEPEGPWGTVIPSEVLLRIFQAGVDQEGAVNFLPSAARVCSLWHQVSSHPSLWRHMDLSVRARKIEGYLVWLCENRLSNVHELNLSGWGPNISQNGLQAISDNCHHLTSIMLSGCTKISSKSIQALADSCPNLQVLDFSQTSRNANADSPVAPNCIKYLMSKRGPKLTHFYLANNSIRSIPALIKNISENCSNLILLDMSNLRTMCRDAINVDIEQLQGGCKKLRVLRLANTSARLANVPLSEQAKSEGFPDLEELSIAVTKEWFSGNGLDDNAVERILKTSNKLKLLDLRHCGRISASRLVRIPAWELEHIFLSQCSAATQVELELIMQKWEHSLIEVDLSWNNAGLNTAIDAAVNALASGSGLSKLQRLDLCGTAVSLDPVINVLKKCINLKLLNLSSCRGLPRGMKRLYRNDDIELLRKHVTSGKFAQFDDIT